MHERIDRVTRQVTSVTLVAAAVIVGPTYLGVGPSLLLAGAFLALGAALGAARFSLLTAVDHPFVRWHLETLWVGPVVAGLAVVVWRGATAGELQAIGGLIGLVGMANYLLRPVYGLVYAGYERVARAV